MDGHEDEQAPESPEDEFAFIDYYLRIRPGCHRRTVRGPYMHDEFDGLTVFIQWRRCQMNSCNHVDYLTERLRVDQLRRYIHDWPIECGMRAAARRAVSAFVACSVVGSQVCIYTRVPRLNVRIMTHNSRRAHQTNGTMIAMRIDYLSARIAVCDRAIADDEGSCSLSKDSLIELRDKHTSLLDRLRFVQEALREIIDLGAFAYSRSPTSSLFPRRSVLGYLLPKTRERVEESEGS
jgi:hypothetical protein